MNQAQVTPTPTIEKNGLVQKKEEDSEMMDEQARHKQLLAQVVTSESRISMADYAVVRERILEQEQALIRLLNFQFSPRKGEVALSRLLRWGSELGLRPSHLQVVLAMLNDR